MHMVCDVMRLVPRWMQRVRSLVYRVVDALVGARLRLRAMHTHKRQLRVRVPEMRRQLAAAVARRNALERELQDLLLVPDAGA